MRLDGDSMLVGIKDAAKLIGIFIITCCAIMVCAMFINYNMDIVSIEKEITSAQVMIFYQAQVSTAKVVSAVSGGCLLITSVIMLLFYIKHYIDSHKKELGILKALGYSNIKIAKNFWVFGISVFCGAILGFIGAFLIMPSFYKVQNKDKILPDISVNFHLSRFVYLVLIPAVLFSLLAVFYAWYKLEIPVMNLLKDNIHNFSKVRKYREEKENDCLFLEDLKKNTLRDKKILVFFIIFASFCFSSMTQMSFSMKDLASVMMGVMTMLIGIILACTTLFLAITTVIHGNTKTIAMMRVFGYSQKECCTAILGGYRPMSYIGFAVGTVYQYALLRIMVDFVFRDIENMPIYKFDFPVMFLSLGAFIVIYELVMYVYSEKIKKISIKQIMLE